MSDACKLRKPALEVRPEPTEDARQALAAALEAARRAEPESLWWRAGVEESVAADER
jgi:hypothetical protein